MDRDERFIVQFEAIQFVRQMRQIWEEVNWGLIHGCTRSDSTIVFALGI